MGCRQALSDTPSTLFHAAAQAFSHWQGGGRSPSIRSSRLDEGAADVDGAVESAYSGNAARRLFGDPAEDRGGSRAPDVRQRRSAGYFSSPTSTSQTATSQTTSRTSSRTSTHQISTSRTWVAVAVVVAAVGSAGGLLRARAVRSPRSARGQLPKSSSSRVGGQSLRVGGVVIPDVSRCSPVNPEHSGTTWTVPSWPTRAGV